MNAEQKKRRDELADKYSDNGQQHEDYLNGYDAGFKDSEIHKASCCMDMELEIDELKRKLEVAKKALEFCCGNRCNAEYNPCSAREALKEIE